MRLGAKIFGALAGILILYLGLGYFLPGSWDARAEGEVSWSPDVVFPYLCSAAEWARWNAMPESGSTLVGPEEGAGSGLDWDDPRYGEGSFRITRCEASRRMEYEVRIEGGSLMIRGTVTLEGNGQGSRLEWEESGDFGNNPLLGYAARGMGRSQQEAMLAGLESLKALLKEEGRPPTSP